jgi:peptidoglycan/LPS O-acetylase OafA/YrhL
MKRQSALDGLRGCAILWVLLYHYVALPAKAAALSANAGFLGFAGYGWVGVNLFFVLSGFLITRGLDREPRDRFYFGSFWAKRAFRIVPPYLLLLVSFFVARALWPESAPGADRVFNGAIPVWSYLVFAQNLFMAPLSYLGNDWLRVLWSLAVEVQFYLFISVALFLIPRRRAVPWLAVLAVGAILFRYALYARNADAAMVVLLPCRLDAFLLGGLVGLLAPKANGAAGPLRSAAAVALMALSAAFLGLYSSGVFGRTTLLIVPAYYTVISIGCVALLDLCATGFGPVAWLMRAPPLVEAGRLSYFIYLFHMPFALAIFHVTLGTAPALGTPRAALAMAAAFVAVCAAAWLSYRFLEAPLIRFSHAIARRPQEATPAKP